MNLDAYERFNGDINDWVNKEIHAMKEAGITVIECADLIQDNASAVILPAAGFHSFIKASALQVVFLYRSSCDVSARIESMIEEVCETGEDSALMVQAFESKHPILVKRAKDVCPDHFYAELTVLHHGGFVATGVVAQAYEDLLEVLQAFCENAEDQQEQAKEAQLAMDMEALDQLAEILIKDPGFTGLRGKRKRCVYVREKYGVRVPPHPRGELRRVDQGADPMDANLVGLVERVTDRLDALR